MPQKRTHLIVGLGNPGQDYKKTRHNMGFMVVDELAGRFGISLDKKKFDTVYGRGAMEGTNVILVKPMAYMNRSGIPIQRLAQYYKILSKDMLVVHDDIDLTLGRLKIKEKGGHGGHNGVRSLIDAFGERDFVRLRLGIGRSAAGGSVTNHVLGRFSKDENEELDQMIAMARDAVVTILTKGVRDGMNRFNRKSS